ncbi:MAG: ribosome biogenesis GTPase Der [Spirochaetaceae bacterium]|jgi:GTP-binding protein|nr:ribosome biogenesis GTPase Der [Spirochaetaceae bacterium]
MMRRLYQTIADPPAGKQPVVVLAGRPNVGKSTLFNRLLHKRRAITDPTPGLTRDPVTSGAIIAGKSAQLVDSGGFKLDRQAPDSPESLLDSLVVERTLRMIERADVVVLILAAGELTPEDEEFIALLRPLRDKLIVAVNKTEGGRLLAETWNLARFGFDRIYPISAEHGDNVGELASAIADKLPAFGEAAAIASSETAGSTVRLSILGKPNTGKSTLSNRLCAAAASIVSEIPGTTRDVIEGRFQWKGRDFAVMDTAGIRRKSHVSENVEYYSVNRAIKTMDEADIVILLIDAPEGFSVQDKKIAALAADRGRGLIFALNKWDAMPDTKNTFEAARDSLHYFFGQMKYVPVLPLSAKTGEGVGVLLNTTIKMYGQLNRFTETSVFNDFLGNIQAENPPPSGPDTRFKVKYGVQVSVNPVIFRLFVSRPAAFTQAYNSYICNKIRKDLSYGMVPVTLEIHPSGGGKRRPR